MFTHKNCYIWLDIFLFVKQIFQNETVSPDILMGEKEKYSSPGL